MAEPAESADSDAIRGRRARGEEAIKVIIAQIAWAPLCADAKMGSAEVAR